MKTPNENPAKTRPHGTHNKRLKGSSLRLSVLLAAGIALGACADIPDLREFSEYAPHKNRQPLVNRVSISHPVGFSGESVILSKEAQDGLDAFVRRAQVDRNDRIQVMAAPEDESRGQRVLAYLQLRRIPATLTITPAASGRVRVFVERFQVTLPGCPDWTDVSRVTFSNRPSSNFGCATATNLGLQIANPRDLVEGRDPGNASGAALVLGIQRYQAGQVREPGFSSEAQSLSVGGSSGGEGGSGQ